MTYLLLILAVAHDIDKSLDLTCDDHTRSKGAKDPVVARENIWIPFLKNELAVDEKTPGNMLQSKYG